MQFLHQFGGLLLPAEKSSPSSLLNGRRPTNGLPLNIESVWVLVVVVFIFALPPFLHAISSSGFRTCGLAMSASSNSQTGMVIGKPKFPSVAFLRGGAK